MYEIAARTALPGPSADAFKAQAKRYADEEKELNASSAALVVTKLEDGEKHEHRDHVLTNATTLLHVSIAVATIAIIIQKQRWPFYSAIGLGVLGVAGAAYAYI